MEKKKKRGRKKSNKKNKSLKNKIIFLMIIVSIVTILITGFSYAWWRYQSMQNKGNNLTSGCFNMELTNEKNTISLENAYPITDKAGLKLKPFEFTINNTCTIFAHYTVNLELLEGSTLDGKFIATRLNNEKIKTLDSFSKGTTTIKSSVASYTLAEGYLGAGDSTDYSLSLWMDKDVTVDDDVFGKALKAKIVIISEPSNYNPFAAGYTTLGDAILANEYQINPEAAKERIAQKLAVDITNTAPIVNWVEKKGGRTTRTPVKIAPSAVKTDTATSNLSERDSKIKLYRQKSFDSDTATYTLSDAVLVDPTEITDWSSHYYYYNEYISYNQSSKKLYGVSANSNREIYEITNATKSNTKTTWNNTSYDTITYNLEAITWTSEELETDKSDKGLYQGTDDYGTTYYYRGNVNNNNVYFGGIYWQIVRINGDGSIRLMYNGTVKNAIGLEKAFDNYRYQFNTSNNSPIYVGYMYGDKNSKDFSLAHSNTNSIAAKTYLESWYKKKIIDKGYEEYISSDVGFCGDRSLSDGDGVSLDKSTYYGSYGRSNLSTASFICPNIERDLYTTSSASMGNKALTYPVGLITYDELVFAGMDSKHINKLSWAYSSDNYWTMSPSFYYSTNKIAYGWILNKNGTLSSAFVTNSFGLRPVINLKSDVKIKGGIGTSSDPFIIDDGK